MLKISSCYEPGVIATIEQFTYPEKELKLYAVFTYYDKKEQSLYIGCSGNFYNTHHLNLQKYDFAEEIEYVGFVFFKNEAEIKEFKKYLIESRNPKYNKKRYKNLEKRKNVEDHLVVNNTEMIKRWDEWLGNDD